MRYAQALALHHAGQTAAAAAIYRELVAADPTHFGALHMLGVIALSSQDWAAACDLIGRAVAVNADSADAWYNLGLAHGHMQRAIDALACYDRSIALSPDHYRAYNNRANVLAELGRYADAVVACARAIACKPDYAEAYCNRGNALRQLRQLDVAVASYDLALTHCPTLTEAIANRGAVLHELERFAAALARHDQALALNPRYAEAWSNRGATLLQLGQFATAVASFDRALEIKPDYAEAYANRGAALKELQQLDAALASYDRALALAPGDAEARWNKSLILLLAGAFADGWALYESRWDNPKTECRRRDFPQPLWGGREPLAGRTILLYSEQGLGDTLQFCRYAALVAALGARVVLEVRAPLVGVLRELAGVAVLLAYGDPLPPFDCHCPLLSLPRALHTRLETIPRAPAYLRADAARVAHWRARLGDPGAIRVGLVWSGNPGHNNDRKRSIPLADLLPFLPAGCTYVSLQQELRERDRAALAGRADIVHLGDALAEFTDTAALCTLMDLIISVDTSVAHLSAALGRRTWLLLPYIPDWRWLLGRDDSPWYPTMKLYRQPAHGAWSAVLAQVRADLNRWRLPSATAGRR